MSINSSTGLFTADSPLGNYTVTATSGSVVGAAAAVITQAASGQIITVNTSTTYQTMDGFGSSQMVWEDPHLNGASNTVSTGGLVISQADKDVIINQLWNPTTGIGLNRQRVHVNGRFGGWQTTQGGTITPDTAFPGPHGTEIKQLLTSIFAINSQFQFGHQMGSYDQWCMDSTNYAAIAAYNKSMVDYLKAGGFEASWVGIMNEPTIGAYGAAGPYTATRLLNIGLALKTLFDADTQYGGRVKTISADDVNDSSNIIHANAQIANTTYKPWIKAIASHTYEDKILTQSSAIAIANNLPLWQTEYNAESFSSGVDWAANHIHYQMVTWNLAAWDMLFGYSAGSTATNFFTYIHINTSNGINYSDHVLLPWYYQIGHWSKYVPRGSVRVSATSSTSDIKVTAFLVSGKKVIVLINNSTTLYSVTIPSGNYRKIQTVLATGGTDRLTDKGIISGNSLVPVTGMVTLIEQ